MRKALHTLAASLTLILYFFAAPSRANIAETSKHIQLLLAGNCEFSLGYPVFHNYQRQPNNPQNLSFLNNPQNLSFINPVELNHLERLIHLIRLPIDKLDKWRIEVDRVLEQSDEDTVAEKTTQLENVRNTIKHAMEDALNLAVKNYVEAVQNNPNSQHIDEASALLVALDHAFSCPLLSEKAALLYIRALNPHFEHHKMLIAEIDRFYEKVQAATHRESFEMYKEHYRKALAILSIAYGQYSNIQILFLKQKISALIQNPNTPHASKTELENILAFANAGRPLWSHDTLHFVLDATEAFVEASTTEHFALRDRTFENRARNPSLRSDEEKRLRLLGELRYRSLPFLFPQVPVFQNLQNFIQSEAAEKGVSLTPSTDSIKKLLNEKLQAAIFDNNIRAVREIVREFKILSFSKSDLEVVHPKNGFAMTPNELAKQWGHFEIEVLLKSID